ncbi:unnamed protein product, partial [Ceratitis capitata]
VTFFDAINITYLNDFRQLKFVIRSMSNTFLMRKCKAIHLNLNLIANREYWLVNATISPKLFAYRHICEDVLYWQYSYFDQS